MKRFIMSLFMLMFAFFFTGCKPKETSDNGGGGNHVEVVNFNYEYDQETGMFTFSNYENGELVLVIDGKTYSINQNEFDVKSVINEEGE